MKITFIHHSSFLVEQAGCCMLFDYFQGQLPDMPKDKPLYVFASHSHGDHFSPEIFKLAQGRDQVFFILSGDISARQVPPQCEHVSFMDPGQELCLGQIKVETFRSTDEGVAFWVHSEGIQIYHAGDLNNWWWEGESKAWNHNMAANYQKELEKMKGRCANVAFVPLDPRQEQWFYLGMDQFLKAVKADVIFPMHMWGNYGMIDQMKQLETSKEYRDRLISIHREGEEFTL